MGFLFKFTKVVISLAAIFTIVLWIALTVMVTYKIKWNDKNRNEMTREVLYSLDANQLGETQKDQLISNAIGVEVLHLLFHCLPCIGLIVGIWSQHFYTIHTMASFSLISLVYDNFDVVNRWYYLNHSDVKMAHNIVYLLSHFFHLFCVFSSMLFAFFVGRQQMRN